MKYLYIQTFGCQMNIHDSEQMAELLKGEKYQQTDDIKKADLVIVNTCSIREKAEQKAYSQIGRLRSLKKTRPHVKIAVGGCLAQQWKRDLLDKVPYVDIVFGTHNIHRLPELIRDVERNRMARVETSFELETKSLGVLTLPENGNVTAFVTVMQGCDNYCAFCVVPYLRGREESRKAADIIEEVKALVDHGVKEITLLGQNVNSYGKSFGNGYGLSKLIKDIGIIDGIKRIRFTTSQPRDLTDDIIHCFRDVDVLCEHLHLPVQSGSDRILEKMNRHYSRRDYLEKISKLREVCPRISITSDVIVGFPGEKEEDFIRTMDLMEDVRFDQLFSFKYSDRPGTRASLMVDKVDEDTKRERLLRLQALQKRITLEKNKVLEGATEQVLVEGRSRNSGEDAMGRTSSNRIVNFRGGPEWKGRMASVRITRAYPHSLRGELMEKRV
jgi:tRNA-2-methylthio-N6-dimethylallyladenosine synthase